MNDLKLELTLIKNELLKFKNFFKELKTESWENMPMPRILEELKVEYSETLKNLIEISKANYK